MNAPPAKLPRLNQPVGADDLSRLMQAIPFARLLGVTATTDDEGRVIANMPFADHLIGNPRLPALHGGTIGAFLEMTAIAQLIAEMPVPGIPKTIDITIDYLRSGRPRDTFARAIVAKHGRRVANVRVEAWQEDPTRPIATAHGHFMLPNESA
ncbi:PaaI family thioesterase [Zavarzinia compransoris]|uniref:PaaI family thioesterase n=1 Tax=Zavarzinia marina TaxID=2911065 RepID=UPI001F4716E4|nr:PaaI family thioesterase [Zavarzinia marina]MCF4167223.1 PaaI family thioesterase [Zavarzinia marina]